MLRASAEALTQQVNVEHKFMTECALQLRERGTSGKCLIADQKLSLLQIDYLIVINSDKVTWLKSEVNK